MGFFEDALKPETRISALENFCFTQLELCCFHDEVFMELLVGQSTYQIDMEVPSKQAPLSSELN